MENKVLSQVNSKRHLQNHFDNLEREIELDQTVLQHVEEDEDDQSEEDFNFIDQQAQGKSMGEAKQKLKEIFTQKLKDAKSVISKQSQFNQQQQKTIDPKQLKEMYDKYEEIQMKKRKQPSPLETLGFSQSEIKKKIGENLFGMKKDKWVKGRELNNWGSIGQFINIKETQKSSMGFPETPDEELVQYSNQAESARGLYKMYGENKNQEKRDQRVFGPQCCNYISTQQIENLKKNLDNTEEKGMQKNWKLQYNRGMIKKFATGVISDIIKDPAQQSLSYDKIKQLQSIQNINSKMFSNKNIAHRSQRLGQNLNEESTSHASEIVPTDGDTGAQPRILVDETNNTTIMSPSYSVEIIKDLNKTSQIFGQGLGTKSPNISSTTDQYARPNRHTEYVTALNDAEVTIELKELTDSRGSVKIPKKNVFNSQVLSPAQGRGSPQLFQDQKDASSRLQANTGVFGSPQGSSDALKGISPIMIPTTGSSTAALEGHIETTLDGGDLRLPYISPQHAQLSYSISQLPGTDSLQNIGLADVHRSCDFPSRPDIRLRLNPKLSKLKWNLSQQTKESVHKVFGSGGRKSPSNTNFPQVGIETSMNTLNVQMQDLQGKRNVVNNSMTPVLYHSQDKSFLFGDSSMKPSAPQQKATLQPIMFNSMNMKLYESGGDSKFSRRALSDRHTRVGDRKPKMPSNEVDTDADQYHFRTNLKEVNIGKIKVLDSIFNLPACPETELSELKKLKLQFGNVPSKINSLRKEEEKEVKGDSQLSKATKDKDKDSDQEGGYDEETQGKSVIKSIYQLQQRVLHDVKHGIVRPDQKAGPSAENIDSKNEIETQMKGRFNELSADYQSGRYREAYGGNENFFKGNEEPEKCKEFRKYLVNRLMNDNIIQEDAHGNLKRRKKDECEKVQQMMMAQLEKSKQLKTFETKANLLGITKEQFVSMLDFEKFYKSRQNLGLQQIEKNQDIMVAKQLFQCWDKSRLGHISVQTLAKNLISFGLAMTEEDVIKLVTMLKSTKNKKYTKKINSDEQVEMKQWIKIFEKDKFDIRAIEMIKKECQEKAEEEKKQYNMQNNMKNQSSNSPRPGQSRQGDSDTMSHLSKGSKRSKIQSNYSGISSFNKPMPSSSKWGDSTAAIQQQKLLKSLEMAPPIADQVSITKDWWAAVNTNQDPTLPVMKVRRFFVAKGLSSDQDTALKEIEKVHGKISELDYQDFFKIFIKGIFRVALLDMITNIEKLSEKHADLPFALKLSAYRRSLLLQGLDNDASGEQKTDLKQKGESILDALKDYSRQVDEHAFSRIEFEEFVKDPLSKSGKVDQELINSKKKLKFGMHVQYSRIKKKGLELGIDTDKIEKDIKMQDAEYEKQLLESLQKQKNKKQLQKFKSKRVNKFALDTIDLQVINEQEMEADQEKSNDDVSYSPKRQMSQSSHRSAGKGEKQFNFKIAKGTIDAPYTTKTKLIQNQRKQKKGGKPLEGFPQKSLSPSSSHGALVQDNKQRLGAISPDMLDRQGSPTHHQHTKAGLKHMLKSPLAQNPAGLAQRSKDTELRMKEHHHSKTSLHDHQTTSMSSDTSKNKSRNIQINVKSVDDWQIGDSDSEKGKSKDKRAKGKPKDPTLPSIENIKTK